MQHELTKNTKRIYAGIAWPGLRPGYICLIGELIQPTDRKFILLDEYEAFDTEDLISRAGALDTVYLPEKILSGVMDKACKKILIEYNKSLTPGKASRKLKIVPSRIRGLEADLFKYALPKLRTMIGPEGELDISKGKMLLNYLSIIQDADVTGIKPGDFPSVEAVVFAVCDLDIDRRIKPQRTVCNKYERMP